MTHESPVSVPNPSPFAVALAGCHSLAFAALLLVCASVGSAAFADDRAAMPERLVAELVRVLDSESAPERVRAAMELARLVEPDPAALEALHAGVDDDAPAVRSACLHALGQIGHEPTLSWILGALNDPDVEVRTAACRAVDAADMGGYARLPFDDPNPAVRLAALQALENASLTSTLSRRLNARLDEEEEPDLRAQLLRLHRLHEVMPPVDALRDALTKGVPLERLEALRCLSTQAEKPEVADKQLIDAVLAQDDSAPAALRRAAVEAVAAMTPADNAAWLARRSADADHTVRKAAARALGQLPHGDDSSPVLQKLQRDPNAEVRRMASMSLARQAERDGDAARRRVERHAVSLCTDEDRAALRREGLWMLGKLRTQAGFPDILELARRDFPPPNDEEEEGAEVDFDPGDLRETRLVVWVVQRSRHQPALPQAIPWFLQKKDAATQFHAARAIAETRYADAVPALADAVLETRVEAGVRFFYYSGIGRSAAIEALAAIANEQALDTLGKLMRMTRPMDAAENLAVMARALAKHGQKEQAVKNMHRIMRKIGRVQADSSLAETYRKITGDDIPSEYRAQSAKQYSSDFIAPR